MEKWIKNNGGPNIKFYESKEIIAQFGLIRAWLTNNFRKYVHQPTNKNLSSLVVQLWQFQEDHFNETATSRGFTRIPAKFFLDFKYGGGLCVILGAVYKFKGDIGWRQLGLGSPNKLEMNVKMFRAIQMELHASKCWIKPCIYFAQRCQKDKVAMSKYEAIAKRHKVPIVELEEFDSATHIIFPPCDPAGDEEVARPVMKKGGSVLLHWYGLPDSHDSWIEADFSTIRKEPADDMPFFQTEHVWRITANWLTDMDRYNEWMNEEDYEVDGCGEKKEHQLRISVADFDILAAAQETSNFTPAGRRFTKPEDKAGQEETGNMAGREKPGNMAGREKPVNMTGREKPTNMAGLEIPANTAGLEKPANMSGREKPTNMAGREKPANMAGREKAANMAGREKAENNKAGRENFENKAGRQKRQHSPSPPLQNFKRAKEGQGNVQSEPLQTSQSQTSTSSAGNYLKMNDDLTKANGYYKESQLNGISRVLKRSYLEKAIRIYHQEFGRAGPNAGFSIMRNLGMANLKSTDVVDGVDEVADMRLVVHFLKEAISSFTRALALRPGLIGSDWGDAILERMKESFEVGLRRIGCGVKDVEKTRKKLCLLDELFKGFPMDAAYGSCIAKCYFAKSQHTYNCSINCFEMNDFRAAVQFLEYAREAIECAKKYGALDVLKVHDLMFQDMEQDIFKALCCCESVRVRSQADELFAEHVHGAEGLNMEMMWEILDMYKDAVLKTRERDVENEGLALCRLGRMFEKIFKMRDKGHSYYRRAFDLAQTLLPRDPNTLRWFIECKNGIERYQQKIVTEEERREDEEKKPILLKLEKELAELEKISGNSYELLPFLYNKYPPKVKYTFDEKELGSATVKNFLKQAITHYHPDRQVRFGLEWKVLCGEITKYLNVRYSCMKGCD